MKVLEVNDISKKLGKKQVLKDVSFFLCANEIVGLVGCNGVGKTTLLKLILGLQKSDFGIVRINGYNIKTSCNKALERVGAIIENPDMYSYLTGRENMELVRKYYKNIDKDRINELVNLVGLEDSIDMKVNKYSLGMKQRLGIAVSLINNPNLLILDEPTNGLDPEGIISLRKILLKLKNITILISSHNLNEINNLCDRVLFMKDGSIVKDINCEDINIEDEFMKIVGN